MAACHSGHTRMVTVWVQGADLSRAARDGSTCLHAAARGGHGAIVKLLLQHGADPAARDRTGGGNHYRRDARHALSCAQLDCSSARLP